MSNKALFIILVLVAFVGFLDASYITAKTFTGSAFSCSITNGCESVLTSKYSRLGPVPISLIGAAYYLVSLALLALYLDGGNKKWLKPAVLLWFLGFVCSLVLVGLQLFVIKSICEFCMLSAVCSTTLFLLGIIINRKTHTSVGSVNN